MENTDTKVTEDIKPEITETKVSGEDTTNTTEPTQKVEATPVEETKPAAPQKVEATPVEETKPAAAPEKEPQKKFDEIFSSLKTIKEEKGTIEVEVLAKIRGGLRVAYQEMPMFLPNSHFSLQRNVDESALEAAVGTKFDVALIELEEDETHRKTVIVSRRSVVEKGFWQNVKVGGKVKGKVASIHPFGIFLDIGGFEGLIHVSRLARGRVEDPKTIAKVGDELEAIIIDVNQEGRKIGLSRESFASGSWEHLEGKYSEGDTIKGTIKRFTDFGTFVEIEPGVQGLLKTQELSWTRRIKLPQDVLKANSVVDLKILSISLEKQRISLSLKQAQENPWLTTIKEEYKVGTQYSGTIVNVLDQGVVVTINDAVDGFIPKSRFTNVPRGAKLPLKPEETIDVVIEEIDSEKPSMILKPQDENLFDGMTFEISESPAGGDRRGDRYGGDRRDNRFGGDRRRDGGNRGPKIDKAYQASKSGSSFTIADLLNEKLNPKQD